MGSPGHDPLAHRLTSRLIVLATLVVTCAAFVGSATSTDPDEIPSVALGSRLLLDVERAVLSAALVSGCLVFLIRGWGGYFPTRLSTTGAEYSAVSQIAQSGRDAAEVVQTLELQLREVMQGVTDRVAAVERELSRKASMSDEADML